MIDINLKPCPFCAGKADISLKDYNDYNSTYLCEAYCLNCGAKIRKQYTVPYGDKYPMKSAATYISKIWNKRASATPNGVADRKELVKEKGI